MFTITGSRQGIVSCGWPALERAEWQAAEAESKRPVTRGALEEIVSADPAAPEGLPLE